MELASALAFAALHAFLAPQRAVSSDATRNPPDKLPAFHATVVVTPERDPEPLALVAAEAEALHKTDLDRIAAPDLGAVLEALPGFHVLFQQPFGGTPMVVSRGFFGGGQADYVQLLVDGVPVADPESGLVDLRAIRTFAVDRVESLGGAASALYGDTAIGGVVQVFTRRLPKTGGEVTLTAGRFATAGVDAAAGVRTRGAALTIVGGVLRTDGYRAHSDERERTIAVSLERNVKPSFAWRLDGSAAHRDRLDPGARNAAERTTDPFGSSPLFRFDRDSGLRGRVSYAAHGTVRRLAYSSVWYASGRDSELLQTLLAAPGVADRTLRAATTRGVGARFDISRDWAIGSGVMRTTAGGDLGHDALTTDYRRVLDTGDIGGTVGRAEPSRDKAAAFATHTWQPVPRFRFTAGARWDRIVDDFATADGLRRTHDAWSPRAGVTLLLGDVVNTPVSFFVQASRGFKAPTLDQLFDPHVFQVFGTTFSISNALLKPEHARSYEFGARQTSAAASWQVVAYRMDLEDEIDFDAATFRFANIGRSRHNGVDASARFFVARRISPSITYAWSRVAPNGEGTQLKNIPEHLWHLGATLRVSGGLSADLQYTRTAGRFIDDANLFRSREMSTLDARVRRRFGRVDAYVDMFNVSNDSFDEYGFVLTGARGLQFPYVIPGIRPAFRIGGAVRF